MKKGFYSLFLSVMLLLPLSTVAQTDSATGSGKARKKEAIQVIVVEKKARGAAAKSGETSKRADSSDERRLASRKGSQR